MDKIRASTWSLTINNPTDVDNENIALARQRGWKVEGQQERGEKGTLHLQLMLRTPQVRLSSVKKMFPRAHIEVARNTTALQRYVTKEETRVAELDTQQTQYPSQQTVWEWFGSLDLTEESLRNTYNEYMWRCRNADMPFRSIHDWKPDYMLEQFDKVMAEKITEGYYCELIAINPQIRAAVRKFGLEICSRHRRQTDRQTNLSGNIVEQEDITDAHSYAPSLAEEDNSSSSSLSSYAPVSRSRRKRIIPGTT